MRLCLPLLIALGFVSAQHAIALPLLPKEQAVIEQIAALEDSKLAAVKIGHALDVEGNMNP